MANRSQFVPIESGNDEIGDDFARDESGSGGTNCHCFKLSRVLTVLNSVCSIVCLLSVLYMLSVHRAQQCCRDTKVRTIFYPE